MHNAEEIVAWRTVDVAVIVPDASPVLTLARIGRLDLFDTFTAPIHIVDQVRYEITKEANDPKGAVNAWLQRMGNRVIIEETLVGLGFQTKVERGETPRSANLGEIAVDEHATRLALHGSPTFMPLVLFEDPDVLQTRIARLPLERRAPLGVDGFHHRRAVRDYFFVRERPDPCARIQEVDARLRRRS
jgi:hypothetical protein